MAGELDLQCQICGLVGLEEDLDGFFYCQNGHQADGIMATAADTDDMLFTQESLRQTARRRAAKSAAPSQSQPRPDFWVKLEDGVAPFEPENPKTNDYYKDVTKTYVMGIQMMIQMQIRALVEEFKVCPIIVDMIEPIWLRFVDSTNIFSDDSADKAVKETETETEPEPEVQGEPESEKKSETECDKLGKRCVMIWYRYLSNKIPLSYSLAIAFLACHLAREPILSTDIIKWTVEGKLPYFVAFVDINKSLELPRPTCPLTSSFMFRPTRVIPIQKLESLAASIAQSIGLELPPVNFAAIASHYLKQLSLPVHIILPHACRIYEWSMPPELWLSASECMPPTHVFVLSILVVSIRLLYNIHGFGKWEMSLSCATKEKKSKVNRPCSSQSAVDDSSSTVEPCNKDLDAAEILVLLQSKYNKLTDISDQAKDLEAYLAYCEEVVFAGMDLSYMGQEEDEIIQDILKSYNKKKKDHKPLVSCLLSLSSPNKRPRDLSQSNTHKTKKPKDDNVQITLDPEESHVDREIRRLKSNMEENKFCYIPPRKRVKRHDYLHYTRKKGSGAYVYAAHADYYLLIRSFARVAQLDVRSMHAAVLSFERRLGWLEKNILHSVKQMPYAEACDLCDLSKLKL